MAVEPAGAYIVTAVATPVREPVTPDDAAGAYINVYCTVATPEQALEVARREVAEAGWTWERFDAMSWAVADDFADNPEGLEYFEQVLIDGVVVVVHTWNGDGDAPDAERRH